MVPVIDVSRVNHGAPTSPVPGEREPGVLTASGEVGASTRTIREGPGTMDAATIAERQREGGGAPSQRAPRERARWWRRGR
jgi:hypothetical protein